MLIYLVNPYKEKGHRDLPPVPTLALEPFHTTQVLTSTCRHLHCEGHVVKNNSQTLPGITITVVLIVGFLETC